MNSYKQKKLDEARRHFLPSGGYSTQDAIDFRVKFFEEHILPYLDNLIDETKKETAKEILEELNSPSKEIIDKVVNKFIK